MSVTLDDKINGILSGYQDSFNSKEFSEERPEDDVLMRVFGITPEIKRENMQYWGRELGMCWQLIISALFESTVNDYGGPLREGNDELCDLLSGELAIDTKYRIGSGDSGTLKKFKKYGRELTGKGYIPILLILRNDNLNSAIKACESAGWIIYTGDETFGFIKERTGFAFKEWLSDLEKAFGIESN